MPQNHQEIVSIKKPYKKMCNQILVSPINKINRKLSDSKTETLSPLRQICVQGEKDSTLSVDSIEFYLEFLVHFKTGR